MIEASFCFGVQASLVPVLLGKFHLQLCVSSGVCRVGAKPVPECSVALLVEAPLFDKVEMAAGAFKAFA